MEAKQPSQYTKPTVRNEYNIIISHKAWLIDITQDLWKSIYSRKDNKRGPKTRKIYNTITIIRKNTILESVKNPNDLQNLNDK